jgi:hypothetical protein
MRHRHIDSQAWSVATVESVLERGDVRDWQELFHAVQNNREVADLVLRVASNRDLGGAAPLARALAERLRPAKAVTLPARPREFEQ